MLYVERVTMAAARAGLALVAGGVAKHADLVGQFQRAVLSQAVKHRPSTSACSPSGGKAASQRRCSRRLTASCQAPSLATKAARPSLENA